MGKVGADFKTFSANVKVLTALLVSKQELEQQRRLAQFLTLVQPVPRARQARNGY